MIKWQSQQKAPDDFPEFMTRVPWRRSGTIQETNDIKSLKHQISSNRGRPFAVYRRVKGTYSYDLVFWLDKVPYASEVPTSELDNFIAELLG